MIGVTSRLRSSSDQFQMLQKGTIMTCSVWKKLHTEFAGIARKIERTDTRRLGGAERNRELNAAARVIIERLHQHEREHGCKPSNEDLKADGERRLREAQQRVETRRGKTDQVKGGFLSTSDKS
jgi:hypothetical protein